MKRTKEEFVHLLSQKRTDTILIGDYVDAKTKTIFKCLIHNIEWACTPDKILNAKQNCPECAREKNKNKINPRKTHEKFMESATINPSIEIIGEYTGILDDLECRCKICEGTFIRVAKKTAEGIGCPICSGRLVIPGINDIATIRPDLVKYFVNEEDTKKYTYGNAKKVQIRCPDCGHEKSMRISSLSLYGYSCPKCGDGVSYPNKFSRYLLDQLPVKNVEYEWCPKWIVEENTHPYRYDNYFEYDGKKYVLEMDGGFHFMKYYKSNLSLEETQDRDREKDMLAENHNIHMIRIDCKMSDSNYIINNILSSELGSIFDLSSIDWDYCKRMACKSYVKSVCDYYMLNKDKRIPEIASLFKLSVHSIQKYLKKGTQLGFCDYHSKREKIVDVYDNSNTSIRFYSVSDCAKYLTTVIGKKIKAQEVRDIIDNGRSFCGMNIFYG